MTSQNRLTATGILLAFLLFTAVITNIFGLIDSSATSLDTSFWLSRFEFWLALLILYVFSKKIERANFLLWTEEKKKVLFSLASIVIILISVTGILTTISIAEHKMGFIESNKAFNKMTDVLCSDKLLLVFTCLTAAFVEEFIFRGYLLPRLQILTNSKWVAIFLSSLLFGLAHFGYADFNRMLFPFIIGVVFSFYYSKYRSLAVLIICHFLMDFYSTYGGCK